MLYYADAMQIHTRAILRNPRLPWQFVAIVVVIGTIVLGGQPVQNLHRSRCGLLNGHDDLRGVFLDVLKDTATNLRVTNVACNALARQGSDCWFCERLTRV